MKQIEIKCSKNNRRSAWADQVLFSLSQMVPFFMKLIFLEEGLN